MTLLGSIGSGLGSVPTGDGNTSPSTTVTLATTIATWPAANFRWFALDGTNGNDANAGFSDISSADAGGKAMKTVASLASIIPRIGNNRKIAIIVAAGTYADSIDTLLQGLEGYVSNAFIVGTVTDATSGAVAFAGTAADRTQAGFVVVPGLNAGGYNPTGAPTVNTMTLQINGGGAPGLPAEPAAPLGSRIRFAANTTTVALQGICRSIVGVPTNASLNYYTLPAVPALTDVFYIEKPGVVFTAGRSVFVSMGATAPAFASGVSAGFQIAGVDLTDTLRFGSGRIRWAGCRWGGAAVATLRAEQHDISAAYVDETATTRTIGGALRVEGSVQWDDSSAVTPIGPPGPLVSVGQVFAVRGTLASIGSSSYCGSGILIDETNAGATQANAGHVTFAGFGDLNTGTFPNATRVVGVIALNAGAQSGIQICASQVPLYTMQITGAGAHPAIQLVARCVVSINAGVAGSTGNTDVGLDLTLSRASIIILPTGNPTVTGAAGDVRLSDGTIITWATAAAGVIDRAGNQIFASPNSPLKLVITANAAVACVFTANVGATGNNVNIQRWAKIPDGAGGFFTFPSWT